MKYNVRWHTVNIYTEIMLATLTIAAANYISFIKWDYCRQKYRSLGMTWAVSCMRDTTQPARSTPIATAVLLSLSKPKSMKGHLLWIFNRYINKQQNQWQFLYHLSKKLRKRDKTMMLEKEAPSFKLQLLNVNNESNQSAISMILMQQ
jgi:hypothetical protein